MDFRRATSEIQNLKVRMDTDEKNEDNQLDSIKEIKKSLGLFLTLKVICQIINRRHKRI